MSEPCVIRADYANWRPVAGRKVLQLVFEVPIEQTADVMAKLGVPMPGESLWCAIAVLDSPVAQRSEPPAHNGLVAGSNPAGATKDRKPFASLPLVQQCAIRCNDNEFKLFLNASNGVDAADKVRKMCGVTSRSELTAGSKPGKEWLRLEGEYQAYLTTRQYADQVR